MFKKEKKPKPWEQQENVAPAPHEAFAAPVQNGEMESKPQEEPAHDEIPSADMDYGDLISTALQKQKKKKNPKKIVLLCIVIGVAALFLFQIIWSSLQGPAPTYAQFETATTGTINQVLTSNGPIKSSDVRMVYAPASAPIEELNVTAGATITAGTQIATFDTTELQRSVESAGASVQQASLQQQQSVQTSNEAAQTASDYQNSLTTMRQQREIANINLARAQENMNTVSANISATLASKKSQLESMRTQQTSLLTSDSAAAVAMQGQIDALAAEVSTLEGQLSAATGAVSAAQADVEYHNSIVSQLESAVTQAEAGVLDSVALAQIQAGLVSPQNSYETISEQLSAAQEGVTAPISGVVTDVQASEGGMAQQYSPLCTIHSLDNVEVQLSLSQYDLDQVAVGQSATVTVHGKQYNGTVSSIDHITTEQASQTGTSSFVLAKVTIENPDDAITLGLEATVNIHTGEAQNVLTVPTTAINTDVDGTYIMVLEEGLAARRAVETGLSSDTMIEVISGLTEGETVLLSSHDIEEGTAVSDDPAYDTQTALSPMMMG